MTKFFKYFVFTFIFYFVIGCKKKTSSSPQVTAPASCTSSTEPLASTTQEYIKFELLTTPTGTAVTSYSFFPTQCFWDGSYGGLGFGSPNFYSNHRYTGSQPNGTNFDVWKSDTTSQSVFPPSSSFFRNYLKVGIVPYSKFANSANLYDNCGMAIRITDYSNVFWSSNPLNSNYKSFQTSNSSFNIVEVSEYTNSSSRFTVKFKATFNCKLYNSSGDSIYLTNGEMIINLSN